MSEALQAKNNHTEALLKLHNVVGTGVGEKYVNGLPTGEPAVLIFVRSKMNNQDNINRLSAEDLVPQRLDNVQTDVIEVGDIVLQGLQQRVRPLLPGYSCGHGSITAGTLGGFFRDRDGDIVALSNNHVMANENSAQIGDAIYQPGPIDSSAVCQFNGWPNNVADLPYFGTLKNFVKINATGNVQDSAITKIHEKVLKAGLVNPTYTIIGKKANGWGTVKVGDQIQKCGRTTGHTTGSVLALHGTFTIEYDFGPAEFRECIVSTFMSKGGDSGSVIYDFNMNAVGLLFAGSTKVTISNPIDAVRAHYGLEIWDGGVNAPAINSWNLFPRQGKIVQQDDVFTITAPANCACYAERYIEDFNSVECVVNSGSDVGATWGTGLAVLWPNGSFKVNLRGSNGGKFGGYYNSDHNINMGRIRPNTDYTLRIRKLYNGSKSIIGEIRDGNQWVVVVAVPSSVFRSKANCVRIGKTDLRGGPTDHNAAGAIGTSTVKSFKISQLK